MSQLTGYQCDQCGKITEEGESVAGWIIVALRQPLAINEDGSEPAQNTVAGDYHSVRCAMDALEKAYKADHPARKRTTRKGGSK